MKLSPHEAMQFGRALDRVLYHIRHANPRYGPVKLGKIDLSDGFYRVWLALSAIPKLGIVFPRYPGEEQLIAFPLVLPMGWVESPPYFCAITETVADLANSLPMNQPLPNHPMEQLAQTPPPIDDDAPKAVADADACSDTPGRLTHLGKHARKSPLGAEESPLAVPVLRPYNRPVAFHDIYVDDYISAIQGRPTSQQQHQRRLLHSIDAIFRPLDPLDPPSRKDVPSQKKMLQGDACLLTRKTVLGWIIDTIHQTLELPAHRKTRLHDIFDSVRGKKRVGLTQWHRVLGELRSMAIGIPGSRGLFSALQTGVKYADKHRVRLTREIHDQLTDFENLANDLSHRPTMLSEIVPDHPVAVGPHDASGLGMGGVWLPSTTNSNLDPILWRAPFDDVIRNELVSDDNPSGTITNSDLELAGNIAHQDVLLHEVDLAQWTVVPLGDNIPSIAWHLKGSTTTLGPSSYLLGMNSLHQRFHRYLSKPDYISGPANAMADDCSRRFDLSDTELLSHFNSNYPQNKSWRIVRLNDAMNSSLCSALLRKRTDPALYLNAPKRKTATGAAGKISAPISASTSTSSMSSSRFLFSRFSAPPSAKEPTEPAKALHALQKWRTTYAPSARRLPAWGPVQTRASKVMANSIQC